MIEIVVSNNLSISFFSLSLLFLFLLPIKDSLKDFIAQRNLYTPLCSFLTDFILWETNFEEENFLSRRIAIFCV